MQVETQHGHSLFLQALDRMTGKTHVPLPARIVYPCLATMPNPRKPATTKLGRRLDRLLEHLGTNVEALARELEINPSTIWRYRNGQRGLTAESKIVQELHARFGVKPEYFTSDTELEPKDCIEQGGGTRRAPSDPDAAEVAMYALSRGMPAQMVTDLLASRAPSGASGAAWWVERYCELADRYAPPRGRKSSTTSSTGSPQGGG
jgi:transcriptional regulator with XRE-family HTH domain